MKFVSRDEWGARERRGANPMNDRPFGITAHWEGPHMGAFAHDKCAGKVRGIQDFHMDGRGWSDIAYNGLACPHGFVFEGRGPHAASAANGFTQVNFDWYAVCYLGGEGDPFTDEGKEAFLDAFGWLRDEGDAGPIRNGHRDHKATACPGIDIYNWVHSLPDDAGNPDTKDWFEMATQEELRAVVREELRTMFRDNDEGAPDIGRARVIDPKSGKVFTLAQLLFGIWNKK